jgi:DNA-binding response OmpR family regulator
VEDDRMIGESLRAALRLEGHAVDCSLSWHHAFARWQSW